MIQNLDLNIFFENLGLPEDANAKLNTKPQLLYELLESTLASMEEKLTMTKIKQNLINWVRRIRIQIEIERHLQRYRELISSRFFTCLQAKILISTFPTIKRPSMRNVRVNTNMYRSTTEAVGPSSKSKTTLSKNIKKKSSSKAITTKNNNDSDSDSDTDSDDDDDEVKEVNYALLEANSNQRVHLAVWLHSRVLDLQNFVSTVLPIFTLKEQAQIIYRIGWLNLWNPVLADGGVQLALERREEYVMGKFFVHLSTVEPGDNWLNQEWRFSRLVPIIPSWELTVNWMKEDGFGKSGFLAFQYYSGEGKKLNGCAPNMKLRIALSLYTLVDIPSDLVYRYFPNAKGKTRKQVDHIFKKYIQKSLSSAGISYTYEFWKEKSYLL